MTIEDKIELWEQRIFDCKSSGLKVDVWCNENDISRHAYYYWHRKIECLKEPANDAPQNNTFVEISQGSEDSKEECQRSGITINWKEFTFSVQNEDNIGLLLKLMNGLVETC